MPGLLAITPPRKAARGREQNNLILYLAPSGNISLTTAEVMQLTNDAASVFYQSPGSLTSAMRGAANDINAKLLARNLSTASHGEHVLGLLVLAALRENQCTLLLSGPTHAVWVTDGGSRHIYEPALSGKGLGSGQSASVYLSQVDLRPQDQLVLCATFPRDWAADLLNERPLASLDASYRKLVFAKGDLNAVLVQAQSGHGLITLLRPDVPSRPLQAVVAPIAPVVEEVAEPQKTEETGKATTTEGTPITEEQLDRLADFAAHIVQPSAYAIPPQPEGAIPLPKQEEKPNGAGGFPASIPRARPIEPEPSVGGDLEVENTAAVPAEEEEIPPSPRRRRRLVLFKPDTGAKATRQAAKVAVGGIKIGRRLNEGFRAFLQKFVPRLLPGPESNKPFVIPTYMLVFIAIFIPAMVSVISWFIYDAYGLSERYRQLYQSAVTERARAASETDPARQRDQWQEVLRYLDEAGNYRETDEVKVLRSEAQSKLDNLMGVIRLEFVPAFPNGLGRSTQISRMAASESDLYMLEAEGGKILHASFTGRSLNLDNAFHCQPGTYGGYEVGTLVDVLALPKVNAVNATALGIDANGRLLYCAPNQVPQAIPLPDLPNMNWGRVTSFAMDSGNLYVLDAVSRAVWVFRGKDSTFVDTPYFYFGNEIPNTIDSAIDMAVSSDDLYLLHADGHLSTCTFSRIAEVPTRCQDPAPRLDNYPAHRDIDIFGQANFTQMTITNQPNAVLLVLSSEDQSVFRFSPRSFELQNQIKSYTGEANPFQSGSVGALAVSPNYVLYLAIGDQVYFATNLP
ncbi:MAG TPA: hypothetical protein VFQ13_23980 [Anaerolineales bacterium]|nr:hypothetical protein [Anaerolineales bacterium]